MTQEKSREQVLDTIQKLLQMTTEHGCTPEEAATAATHVQRLLFKHKLSMAEVKDISEPEALGDTQIPIFKKSHEGEWRAQLINAITRYNFCGLVYNYETTIAYIIGKPTEVEVVKGLYAWIMEQLERHCKWAVQGYHGPDRAPTFRRSFYSAAVLTIKNRLYRQFDDLTKETEQSTALVVVSREEIKQYTDDKFGPLKSKSWSTSNGSHAGTRAGIEAGLNIDLTRPSKRLRGE